MTAELLTILNDNTNNFIDQVRTNLSSTGTNATGETADSLRFEISESGPRITLEIFGRPYFATVETGRRAGGGISRDMIDNITKWVNARGLDENMVWAIAKTIDQKGTLLYRNGGRTDIYTDLKDDFADKIFQEVTEAMADELSGKIYMTFVGE